MRHVGFIAGIFALWGSVIGAARAGVTVTVIPEGMGQIVGVRVA
jgi:hypothetical protein